MINYAILNLNELITAEEVQGINSITKLYKKSNDQDTGKFIEYNIAFSQTRKFIAIFENEILPSAARTSCFQIENLILSEYCYRGNLFYFDKALYHPSKYILGKILAIFFKEGLQPCLTLWDIHEGYISGLSG